MKISEIFTTIQGEGKYVGYPVLFIRLSGCSRQCSFCDTKYHLKGKNISTKEIAKEISKSKCEIVVFTGGEPMLQEDDIFEVITEVEGEKQYHLETNGDILPHYPLTYNYICFSPKDEKTTKNVQSFCELLSESGMTKTDIKIVTDLKLNKDLIKYATMLMPLTTYTKKDRKIQQDVWEYCVKHKLRFSPRLQVGVWNKKRGV